MPRKGGTRRRSTRRRKATRRRRHHSHQRGGSDFGPPSFVGGLPNDRYFSFNVNQGGPTDPINPASQVDTRQLP